MPISNDGESTSIGFIAYKTTGWQEAIRSASIQRSSATTADTRVSCYTKGGLYIQRRQNLRDFKALMFENYSSIR